MKTKFQQKYERFLESQAASKKDKKASNAEVLSNYEKQLSAARQAQENTDNSMEMLRHLSGLSPQASTWTVPDFRAEHTEIKNAEVAQYVTEGAQRFWELAGLEYGPMPTSQRWESAPSDEEDAPAQGPWKKLLTEKPFEIDSKSHKFSKDAFHADAVEALKVALRANSLPVEGAEDREVTPDEFVFQGVHTGHDGKAAFAHFKHKGTRNHIHLDLGAQTLVIPHTDAPFHRGSFGNTAEESMQEFRNLAGLVE